jgi:hypothetical protein
MLSLQQQEVNPTTVNNILCLMGRLVVGGRVGLGDMDDEWMTRSDMRGCRWAVWRVAWFRH